MPKSAGGRDMIRRRPADHPPLPGFDLQIDELVLHGYTPAEGRAIAAALERELGRLLSEGTAPFAPRHGGRSQDIGFDRLDAGTVTHPQGASPTAIGRSAARAVVQRLRTAGTEPRAAPARRSDP